MLIDWFTVSAQALNFIILVWLMKKFLYKPVLNAIDEREHRIAGQLNEARTIKAEAQKERETYEQKNLEFDQQRTEMLDEVTSEIKNERRRLLEEAGKAADVLRESQNEMIKNELQKLHRTVHMRVQNEVFAIVRKTLNDLASSDLEEQICNAFIRRLEDLDDQMKTETVEILKTASEPVLVRSAFELGDKQQKSIQNALQKIATNDLDVRFEHDQKVVAGIELTANGKKIAWSIAEYLDSFEKSINEILHSRSISGASEADVSHKKKTDEQKSV
jgi:F-type H+-transporting ATPase subunit b